MSWRLRDNPEVLRDAAARIKEETGVPASHLEKDFWVTEILRAVAVYAVLESTTIVFKGGTSLSKAYRLIRRFSEDVDLIVSTSGESKSAADRTLKGIATAAGNAIGVTGVVDGRSATKGQKRTVNYDYPILRRVSGLRRGVLLELRARGGTLPAQTMSIGSLIAEHGPSVGIQADFEEAEVFDLRVLEPVRTLVEKLMILHHAAVTGDEVEQVRHARHYYDIFCLLNDEGTTAALNKWPCDALACEVEIFTAAAGLKTSPRPLGGFGESPAFVAPSQRTREAFRNQVIGELIWGDADKPTFEQCCAVVMCNAAKL